MFSPTLMRVSRFVEAELLTGSNQWRAGDHGLQDARKGVRFVSFPPVLQVRSRGSWALSEVWLDPETSVEVWDGIEGLGAVLARADTVACTPGASSHDTIPVLAPPLCFVPCCLVWASMDIVDGLWYGREASS